MVEWLAPNDGASSFMAPEDIPRECACGPLQRRSDSRGMACAFNVAWLKFTDRHLEASVRNGWLQDVHPEDRSRCLSIHAEMFTLRAPYSLDYRLRHAVRGYRWVMEQATPASARDGSFDGFEHHCMDVDVRTELGERLANHVGRLRHALHGHAKFAAALATELAHLPAARVEIALATAARVVGARPLPPPRRRSVASWLGRLVDDAHGALPPGTGSFALTLPAEAGDIDIDSPVIDAALVNALVCVSLLSEPALHAAPVAVGTRRVGEALLLALPALPGASAYVLLDLALRMHNLPCGQMVGEGGAARWQITLPLAAPEI